jgi:hypothetical protein
LKAVPLLLDSDYERLRDAGISFQENEANRFLVFLGVSLSQPKYNVAECDVLVVVPPNYPQAGNDMFWTYPSLNLADGRAIPQVLGPGGGDNRIWNGREFCRWSRHWQPDSPGAWRPGKDDVMSIYRRVIWALGHPDCK